MEVMHTAGSPTGQLLDFCGFSCLHCFHRPLCSHLVLAVFVQFIQFLRYSLNSSSPASMQYAAVYPSPSPNSPNFESRASGAAGASGGFHVDTLTLAPHIPTPTPTAPATAPVPDSSPSFLSSSRGSRKIFTPTATISRLYCFSFYPGCDEDSQQIHTLFAAHIRCPCSLAYFTYYGQRVGARPICLFAPDLLLLHYFR